MNKDKRSSVLQADTHGEHNQKCVLMRMVTWGQQWPSRWCGRCLAGLQCAASGQGLFLLPLSAPPAAPALSSKVREGKSLKYFFQSLEPHWVLCVLVDGKVNESAALAAPRANCTLYPLQLRISYNFRILRPLEIFSVLPHLALMLRLKGMEPHIYGQKSQKDPWEARRYPWGLCGKFSWIWLTAQPRTGIWVCLIPASRKFHPKWSVGASSSSSSSLYLGCDFFSHPIWACKFYFSPVLDRFFSLIPSLGHNFTANSTFSCHVSYSPIMGCSCDSIPILGCDSGAAVGHDLLVFHFSAVLVWGLALSCIMILAPAPSGAVNSTLVLS